jgi:PAS domain S-box-containing protein
VPSSLTVHPQPDSVRDGVLALTDNDDLYRDLVENSRDLICTHDLNGVLLTVNHAAARALGYDVSELVNRNLRELLSPKVHKKLDIYLADLREKQSACGTIELWTRSGEIRIWEYSSTLRTAGVPVPFVRGMAHDITNILNSQKALRESEERLRIAAEVGRMYAWEWDPVTDAVRRSAECEAILGVSGPAGESVAKDFFALIHPDDKASLWNLATSLTPDSPSYRTEYRRFRPEGGMLWLGESGHATFDEAGKMVRLIGMTADITERKHAEEELAKIGGRLIHAQEEERTRIALEIHEDVCQRLSLLGFQLDELEDAPLKSRAAIRKHVCKLRKHVLEILGDLRVLSQDLHPPILDLLPLSAALRSLCKKFGQRHKVKIDFTEKDVPSPLSKEISICLFRIVQEALRNGIKHSEARNFHVLLSGTDGAVQLSVSDAGVGFEPKSAMNYDGLGLISMRERITLVNGTIDIRSKPKGGTEILCSIPVGNKIIQHT